MLRDYQQTCIEAVLNYVKYKQSHCIVQAPTGSGKSHLISNLSEILMQNGNVLILAHRKELLEQNQAKFKKQEYTGIISAGLGTKDYTKPITIAGVQTLANSYQEFDNKHIKYILVDECHRLSNKQDGQYWDIINHFENAIVIGFTATPYRTDEGALEWGEICYQITAKSLMDKGYLCPLTNKVSADPDLSNAKIVAGEYKTSDVSAVMCEDDLIGLSVEKLKHYSANRNSVLIFCTDINHVNKLHFAMATERMRAEKVTGATPKKERAQILQDFKDGKIKYLLNCEVLTTGFDAPNIDMILVVRPTMSKSLHVQILGRGTRLFDGKENCLIIDMAGNLKRHGGIDSPYTGKQGKKQEATNEKVCPNCESLIPSHHKECPECGYEFIVEQKEIEHETKEDKESSLIGKTIQAKWYEVDFCQFSQHYGKSGKFSLRVDFYCGYDRFSKWLVPLHESQFAANKARFVLDKMNPKLDYSCNDYEILAEQLSENHQTPISIYVDTSGKYADILQYEWYAEPVDEIEIIEELDDNIPF